MAYLHRLPYSRDGLAFVHAIAMDPDSGKVIRDADAGGGGMAVGV